MGPLKVHPDHQGNKKFILVGAYTWVRPKGTPGGEEHEEPPEDSPILEDKDDEKKLEAENAGDGAAEEELQDPRREDQPQEEKREEEEPRNPEDEGHEFPEQEDFEIEVYRMAIPMESKSGPSVMDGIIQIYLQLMTDGFPIRQLHTDRAREFMAKDLERWCKNRCIYKTTTSGDAHQQNGRAERAVQAVKARIRTLLFQKGWGIEKWPLACWNAHHVERRRMIKDYKPIPPFGAVVLARRRYWRAKELEPTHQRVTYISPMPENHGHLVLREDGGLQVTAYVITKTKEPPHLEETWLAVKNEAEDLEAEDALRVRRRIRGKAAVRWIALEFDEEEILRLRAARKAMEVESLNLLQDEEEVAKLVHRHLKSMMKEVKVGDEENEEVLRTKVVPVAQFLREAELWTTAIETEMNQLFQEKGALRRATMAQLQRMREEGKEVELIPSKLVITMKPGPKRKVRIVACGNYVESKGEELYAAGADASALRLVLKITAEKDWELLTTDVRVAFLNAPLTTTLKDGTEGNFVFALKPPSLLVRLNFAREDEVWVAEKAMYGLRQAPRCWSIHRDEVLRSLRVKGCYLRQVVSEANLWVLQEEGNQLMKGMMLVYVDDLLITGEKVYAEALVEEIQRTWQTSNPEKISDGQVTKFLGMEIYKEGPNIKASQASFIKDRLSANLGEGWKDVRGSTVPCSRDIGEIDDEKEITTEEVREAQRIVGELLWLVTRTRMDLMYVTSRLSQMVLRAPREVHRASRQVWAYLKKTASQGLLFTPDVGVGWAGECELGLQAYSDASFAPGGGHSIGSVIIKWNGSPMLWRAGKQPFPTLSAAEAELTEATEALIMGDSFDAILTDIFENYPKSLMIDNQAAIQLISEENGAWRTRHLRMRASHLRWRFSRLDWRVIHCPGVVMAADLGTKPLAGSRIEELKKICGMSTEIEEQEVKRGEDEGLGGAGVLKKAIKLLVVASLLQTIEGQPDEEERNRERTTEDTTMFYVFIICYTFVVMLAMSVFQRMWRTLGERYHGPREPVSRDEWRQYDRQRRYDEANMVIEEAHQALAEGYRRRRLGTQMVLDLRREEQAEREGRSVSRGGSMSDSRDERGSRSSRSRSAYRRANDDGDSRHGDASEHHGLLEGGEEEPEEAQEEGDEGMDYQEEAQDEGGEEEPQGDAMDGLADMMEDPLGREEEALDDPTVHPHYHDWPVSAFRRGKGPGKGRAAGSAPRFNVFGRPMLRGLHLPPHLDVTNEEQLATYARNVWRGVNPGGEASSSGVRRDPQPEAIPTGAPRNQEEEVPRPAFLQPLPEEPMAEDSIALRRYRKKNRE